MHQSRMMSLMEALANVAVGYGAAVLGLNATVRESLAIGAIFTVVAASTCNALRAGGDQGARSRTRRSPMPHRRQRICPAAEALRVA